MTHGDSPNPDPTDGPRPLPDGPKPFDIRAPETNRVPLIVASPHSGNCYPPSFREQTRLQGLALRRSEDAFVDELFAAAPSLGAPLLRATFPRAFVDVNREAYELDPTMFEDELPDYVLVRSARIAAGLGTIPRIIGDGQDIYTGKLTFAEARRRIEGCYRPYHDALAGLIEETVDRFGLAILIDAHSMPSRGGALASDPALRETQFILGDRHGLSCASAVVEATEATLTRQGYPVLRNHPYAGGYTTEYYGRPDLGVHVLQIEINRAAYMNETTLEKTSRFATVAAHMAELVETLAKLDRSTLIP